MKNTKTDWKIEEKREKRKGKKFKEKAKKKIETMKTNEWTEKFKKKDKIMKKKNVGTYLLKFFIFFLFTSIWFKLATFVLSFNLAC